MSIVIASCHSRFHHNNVNYHVYVACSTDTDHILTRLVVRVQRQGAAALAHHVLHNGEQPVHDVHGAMSESLVVELEEGVCVGCEECEEESEGKDKWVVWR